MKTYKYQLSIEEWNEFYPMFKKVGIEKEEGPRITGAEYCNIFIKLGEQEKAIIDENIEFSRKRKLDAPLTFKEI